MWQSLFDSLLQKRLVKRRPGVQGEVVEVAVAPALHLFSPSSSSSSNRRVVRALEVITRRPDTVNNLATWLREETYEQGGAVTIRHLLVIAEVIVNTWSCPKVIYKRTIVSGSITALYTTNNGIACHLFQWFFSSEWVSKNVSQTCEKKEQQMWG